MLTKVICLFLILVIFASFLETRFQVTEPAMVEILITIFGAVSPFDVNITVEIDFASATGKIN